jgi:hypothetical protein
MGKKYRDPHLDLFSDRVRTGCGVAPAAVGPFYCPADETVYIDPTFFAELEQRLGGSAADFSKAYVIAHEVGHHVQKLLGYSAGAHDNQASVRLELMAGCGHQVGPSHRRRPVTEAVRRVRSAGEVHPRHLAPAGVLLQARAQNRRRLEGDTGQVLRRAGAQR